MADERPLPDEQGAKRVWPTTRLIELLGEAGIECRYSHGDHGMVEWHMGDVRFLASNNKSVSMVDEDGNVISTYESITAASIALGLNPTRISDICCGRSKTTKGTRWQYA